MAAMRKTTSPSTRHLVYAIVLLVIAIGYALYFARGSAPGLSRLIAGQSAEPELAAMQMKLALIEAQVEERERLRARVRGYATLYNPAGTSHDAIREQVAALVIRAGIPLVQTLGASQPVKDNPFLEYKVVSLNGEVDMKKLAAFQRLVESDQPFLEWTSFNVTKIERGERDRAANPEVVNIARFSGSIRGYVLTEDARAALASPTDAEAKTAAPPLPDSRRDATPLGGRLTP